MNTITEKRFIELYDATSKRARDLAISKNKEYGSSFAKHGALGTIIRVSDKIDRHVTVTNRSIQVSEKLEDDLLDMINYLVYAYFLIQNQNDKIKTKEDGKEEKACTCEEGCKEDGTCPCKQEH